MRGVPVCCSRHPLAKISMVSMDGTGPHVARVQWVQAVRGISRASCVTECTYACPSQNLTPQPRRLSQFARRLFLGAHLDRLRSHACTVRRQARTGPAALCPSVATDELAS